MLPLPIPPARIKRPLQALTNHDSLAAMGDWLGTLPWDAWGTFTWGDKFGPTGPSSDRALYHFTRWIGRADNRIGYFAAVESGSFGRTHLHALLSIVDDDGEGLTRKALWRSWFTRYGRCEIRGYDAERGAAYYVAKYLTKAPLHWDIKRVM